MNIYTKHGRCKICKCQYREDVDKYLEQGKAYNTIADWVNKQDPSLNINKKNVWSHNTQHRLQDPNATKPPRKGRKKGLENEKPIKNLTKPKKNNKTKTKKENIEYENKTTEKKPTEPLDIDVATNYLDNLIRKANELLNQGMANVTITEAIKAIELKHKISKGSPYEKAMIDFIEKIVYADDNTEKID